MCTKIRTLAAFCFLLFLILFNLGATGQLVSGKIVNEQNEPVPYATVFVPETREGSISNAHGDFRFQLAHGEYRFVIRSMGYVQTERTVSVNSDSLHLDFVLKRQEFEIKEVKVFPGKEDPAYFIMRKAIAKAPYYRRKIKHYEAELYVKSNFALTNIPKLMQNKVEVNGKKLKEVLKENVTYVIESQNKITYDYPNKYDQKVISKKTSFVGFDEPPVMQMITTSFYEERPMNVVSPLSSLALRHYNFRYEGFISVGSFDVFKIEVTPKRKSDELIEGYIYIVDQLWCIYNLDFKHHFEIFDFRIKQQYENVGNNNWLPVSHGIDGTMSALGLRGQFYYGTSLKYLVVEDNSTPDEAIAEQEVATTKAAKPANEKKLQLQAEVAEIISKEELTNADVKKAARLNRRIEKEQYKDSTFVVPKYNNYKTEELKDSVPRTDAYWDTVRAIPLSQAELQSYALMDSLVTLGKLEVDTLTGKKSLKETSLFKKIIGGDHDLIKDSLVQLDYDGLISPENFDFNAVDGYKYRQRFELKFLLDSGKNISITPEIGYAFSRKKWYGSLTNRFENVFAKKNSVAFAIGKESRDFKSQDIGIHPVLNSFSSWFFAENYMKLYETTFLNFTVAQKLKRNLTAMVGAAYNQFNPLENHADYVFSDKKDFSPNIPGGLEKSNPALAKQKSFEYTLRLDYRQRQLKPWLTSSPFLFMNDFYTVGLQFNQGLKNVFSSVSDFSQIDFNFHQQANISPTAGIDWQINAGHFFNYKQLHFSQFKHFKTAEIPVFFNTLANTFHLPGDYGLSTNKSYLNVGGELRSEYVLLRYLSFINQKTWSESLHVNTLALPNTKIYWEAGYSLNSLFFLGNIGVFAGFKGGKFDGVQLKVSISPLD